MCEGVEAELLWFSDGRLEDDGGEEEDELVSSVTFIIKREVTSFFVCQPNVCFSSQGTKGEKGEPVGCLSPGFFFCHLQKT